MQIRKKREDEIAVLQVEGSATIGRGDSELREALMAEIDAGSSKILLDLSDVDYMDSAGVGEIVWCKKACKQRGARLRIVVARNKRLWKLLSISQLIVHFNIFSQRADALAELRSI